jgi:hypothetical protein
VWIPESIDKENIMMGAGVFETYGDGCGVAYDNSKIEKGRQSKRKDTETVNKENAPLEYTKDPSSVLSSSSTFSPSSSPSSSPSLLLPGLSFGMYVKDLNLSKQKNSDEDDVTSLSPLALFVSILCY